MLNEVEKRIIYKSVIHSLLKKEKSKKGMTTIDGKEILELTEKRYIFMQEVLSDLKRSLTKDFEITNIYFINDGYNNSSIWINYENENKGGFFVITQYDLGRFELSYSSGLKNKRIIEDNKYKFIKAFNDDYIYNFANDIKLPSTSGQYSLKCNSNQTIFNYKKDHTLDLNFSFSTDSNSQLLVTRKIDTCYPKLDDLLKNNANVNNLLQNMQFYEKDVPKSLIKTR